MLGVISAEMLKLTRNRATWGLVWIYPIVLAVLFVAVMVITLTNSGDPAEGQTSAQWLEGAAGFWNVPRNTVVRILVAGFIAVAFAGEYGWNTWKLIVPHRSRWMLIAAKYVVATLLLLASFTLAALMFNGIVWAEDRLSGDPIPGGVTAGALLEAHRVGALTIIAPLLLTIGYASLAAILTRSTVGALIASIVLIVVEQTIANYGPMLAVYMPNLVWFLYNVLPGYHLSNVHSWIVGGVPDDVRFPSGTMVSYSLGASLAVLAAWIAGLKALTFWRFGRQDIN